MRKILSHQPGFRRPLVAAIAATLIAFQLTGCSTNSQESASPTPTSASNVNESAHLGDCLRKAGFDVEDPDLNKGVVVAPPEGVDPNRYDREFQKCRADNVSGGNAKPSPEQLKIFREYELKIAQCVRDKGFPEFADPGEDGFEPRSTTAEDSSDKALSACESEFPLTEDGKDGK